MRTICDRKSRRLKTFEYFYSTTTWKDFIARHMAVMAGVDFFTVEVLTWRGLVTYYVLFFLHLETRRVSLAGVTRHPTEEWMEQMAVRCTHRKSKTSSLHRIHHMNPTIQTAAGCA